MKDMNMICVDLWGEQPGNDAKPGGETYEGWEHEKAYQNMKYISELPHYAGRMTLMRMTTAEAAKEVPDASLDFVFVDADHSYEGCRADIEAWKPKVRKGGLLSGHDYNWDTVAKAVKDTGGHDAVASDNVWLRYV